MFEILSFNRYFLRFHNLTPPHCAGSRARLAANCQAAARAMSCVAITLRVASLSRPSTSAGMALGASKNMRGVASKPGNSSDSAAMSSAPDSFTGLVTDSAHDLPRLAYAMAVAALTTPIGVWPLMTSGEICAPPR